MTVAILLLVCVVLARAVGALVVALRQVTSRLSAIERGLVTGVSSTSASSSPGLVTGASAPSSTSEESEFVITQLGSEPEDESAPTLETRLFADVVMRETVVKAASLAYGVRRGLSPANRNRIWFEMRREVKRARKDRKAEEREAIREWRARRRAGVPMGQEESAA
ncbi:MAG: hypothetical protein ABIO16_11675 [Nocardioides sp.]